MPGKDRTMNIRYEGGAIYRTVVEDKHGNVLGVLPTWSDARPVREARPDLIVTEGQWIGNIPGMRVADAPEITDASYVDFLARVGP